MQKLLKHLRPSTLAGLVVDLEPARLLEGCDDDEQPPAQELQQAAKLQKAALAELIELHGCKAAMTWLHQMGA